MTRIIVTAIVLISIAYILTAPTEQDIKDCMDYTGWTQDRCDYELNR